MKTMQLIRKTILLSAITLVMVLVSMNQSVAQTDYDPTGTWAYTVSMPDTQLKGDMVITKAEDGTYEVLIKSSVYGNIELKDVTFKEMVLEGNAEIDGGNIEFEFKFDGDDIEGAVYTPDGTLSMTAERKKN